MVDENRREALPSDKAAIKNNLDKERMERAGARESVMRQDFTRTFQTEHGKRVLAWLQERCNHNKNLLTANSATGTIDPMLTTFAAMEQTVYYDIRKNLPNNLLQEIEYGYIKPSGTISEPGTGNTVERRTSRNATGQRSRRAGGNK